MAEYMKPLLKISHCSKIYQSETGETKAIEDFSLDVYEGEFIGILGPSGCGKSTILSMIASLTPASGGTIVFDRECGGEIGYMLQHDELFPWKTIEKNALMGLDIQKKNTREKRMYVHSLLDMYGLKEFKKCFPKELSGGMKQRVSLIRTLALSPSLLLLDEPFSALDAQTRIAVREDVKKILEEEHKTAILVTHDIEEAVLMSSKIILLSHRPAKIKQVYEVGMDGISPKRRYFMKEFSPLCERIQKDLEEENADECG